MYSYRKRKTVQYCRNSEVLFKSLSNMLLDIVSMIGLTVIDLYLADLACPIYQSFAFLISFFMIHTHNGRPQENPDLRTPLAVFSPLLFFKTNTTGCREWQNSLDDIYYRKNSWLKLDDVIMTYRI